MARGVGGGLRRTRTLGRLDTRMAMREWTTTTMARTTTHSTANLIMLLPGFPTREENHLMPISGYVPSTSLLDLSVAGCEGCATDDDGG